jgi:sRNA-binding protein
MQAMQNTAPEQMLDATATAAPAGPKPKQHAPRQAKEVNPVLEKLFELHPNLFGAKFLPLKLGIFHDLLARHPDVFKKDELKLAMGQHARSTRYLECVAAGLARHDLDGVAVEPVAPEHVHHAILEVFRRRQARSKENLRPRLTMLLKQAIENSGLRPDDYAALVRVQDEATAELKSEAAKREALMVTFTASGKTEAEFADMYGMDLKLVNRMLARVRSELAIKTEATT